MTSKISYCLSLLTLIALSACSGLSSPQTFDVHIWQSTRYVPEDQGTATLYRLPFEINFVVPGFKANDPRKFRIDYAATINQSEVARFKRASAAQEAVSDSAQMIVGDQATARQLITGSDFYTGLLFDNVEKVHSFRGIRKEPSGLQADIAVFEVRDESRGVIPLRSLNADEIHLLFTFIEIDPQTGQEEVKQSKRLLIKFKETGS